MIKNKDGYIENVRDFETPFLFDWFLNVIFLQIKDDDILEREYWITEKELLKIHKTIYEITQHFGLPRKGDLIDCEDVIEVYDVEYNLGKKKITISFK